MTDKLRAAAEQALEAIEYAKSKIFGRYDEELIENAIAALRTALAEQPAEPVAIVTALSVHADGVVRASLNCELPLMMELYAAPPTPEACKPTKQPLTDEELRDALRNCPHDTVENLRVRWLYAKDFARSIERAHGINVPQAQGEQE